MNRNLWVVLPCLFALLLGGCARSNDLDRRVADAFAQCPARCTVDFSRELPFLWDTMYYFSGACSLEEINAALGVELPGFTDIGDRVVFLHRNRVVYHQQWFHDPEAPVEGVVFDTDRRAFHLARSQAQFTVKKVGPAFHLTRP